VRHDSYVAVRGKREDLAQLGHASHFGHARLNEVHGPGVEQAAEFQQRPHILPRGDTYAPRAA
jgi:hypothetical protein